jgi:RNA polymerase sigma-70 factor (ECF subfamily)
VVSEVLVGDGSGLDRLRFDEFVRGEFEAVLALALALLRDEDDAVEVAQEAMLRAFERWEDVSLLDRPGAWARRVALNLVTDRLRSRTRRHRLLERLRAVGPPDRPVVPVDDGDEQFWVEVAALRPRQRAAIVLHYVDDLSVVEIAAVLEVPVGTVKSDLSRGRVRLASRLRERR